VVVAGTLVVPMQGYSSSIGTVGMPASAATHSACVLQYGIK